VLAGGIQPSSRRREFNVTTKQTTGTHIDEAALLIGCLRGLPLVVSPDTDWQALVGMAKENGVLALAHQSLLEMHAEMPEFFTAAARESRSYADMLATELDGLLHQFAERGIDVLPLKGPTLAQALYGDATLRSFKDLDLLVRRDDYPRAEALLIDLGFAAGAVNDSEQRFSRERILVELHFDITSPRIFQFDLEGIWSRSCRGNFRGKPMHVMSVDDLVLYLCSHGLSHGFSRLIWILDVARALDALEVDRCRQVMRHAQSEGLVPWLLIGCEVVRAMFPQQLPKAMDAVISESPKEIKRARRAASRLFAEGLGGVSKTYGRSYLESGDDAIKRWRYRLGYFAPTAEDYRWAERHRINPRLMPMFRPLRLLQKYGPARAWRIIFPSHI
jgi:hypothetical protein